MCFKYHLLNDSVCLAHLVICFIIHILKRKEVFFTVVLQGAFNLFIIHMLLCMLL